MSRKSKLDDFVEYLSSCNHENDYLDVLKVIYESTKNKNIFDEHCDDDTNTFFVKSIFLLYAWYKKNHDDEYTIYIFDRKEKIKAIFDCVLSDMIDVNNDKSNLKIRYEFKALERAKISLDSYFWKGNSDKYLLVYNIDDGFFTLLSFSKVANPLFRSLKSHPEIDLYLTL